VPEPFAGMLRFHLHNRLNLPCRRRTPQPQISHLRTRVDHRQRKTIELGDRFCQGPLFMADLCVPPQIKHTVRSHLEDRPGSLRLAMGCGGR
jgi:hypothetical protein